MDFAEQLNRAFDLGDKLRVKYGDERIDGTGSFIRAENGVLVWSDDDGRVIFTRLGDGISVIKV